MKKTIKLLSLLTLATAIFFIGSCKKDEGRLPDISFKTGAGYVSSDITLPGDTTVTIGINAAKTEDEDVLKTFNISLSFNGSSSGTVYDQALTAAEEDNFSYDYDAIILDVPGTYKYTFTITNRDGLVNSKSITITVQ